MREGAVRVGMVNAYIELRGHALARRGKAGGENGEGMEVGGREGGEEWAERNLINCELTRQHRRK